MAGTLTATTIQNDTSSPPTFRNNSVEIGRLCRAWVTWSGSAGTIQNSFNFSSMTKVATGRYTFSFTTAMPDITFAIVVSADIGTAGAIQYQSQVTQTTTTLNEVQCWRNDNGNLFDPTRGYLAIFSS
jgi:hypothetical protein